MLFSSKLVTKSSLTAVVHNEQVSGIAHEHKLHENSLNFVAEKLSSATTMELLSLPFKQKQNE